MSDVAPYGFRAPLTACIDVKSPHAYLALAPTAALADALDVVVDWLPLTAAALKRPVPPGPDADRGAQHRWHRARYREQDLERYANARGLKLADPYRVPDSTLASASLLWVRARAPQAVRDFLFAIFERYWSGALDIESPASLRALVARVGAPADDFEEYVKGPGRAEVASLGASLRAAGAFNVPTYFVGGEPFLGRQHLPMMRRLLTGEGAQP